MVRHTRMNSDYEPLCKRRSGRLSLKFATLQRLRIFHAQWQSVVLNIYDIPGLQVYRDVVRLPPGRHDREPEDPLFKVYLGINGWMCQLHVQNVDTHWGIDLKLPQCQSQTGLAHGDDEDSG